MLLKIARVISVAAFMGISKILSTNIIIEILQSRQWRLHIAVRDIPVKDVRDS